MQRQYMPGRDESVHKAKIYKTYPKKITKYTAKYIQI